MKNKMIFAIVFSGLMIQASAADGIVKIGNKVYDEAAIVSVMQTNNLLEPFTAIEVLRQQEMTRQLAEKRDLDMAHPEKALYFAVAGEDLEKDRELKNTPDIPLSMKRPASLREGLFKEWVATLAEKRIPVRIIDYGKLWDIFKQTDSYKIRAEHGQEMNPEDMSYTWADLSVDPADELALQNGELLVSGEEFNAYLKINKTAVTLYGKRSRSPTEARSDIVHLMVAGKLLAKECRKKNQKFADIEMDKAVSKLVRDHMIDEDFDVKNIKGETISDYMKVINTRRMSKNKAKSDKLRSVLKGKAQCDEKDYAMETALMHTAYAHSQMQINNEIDDDEVYEWMKVKKFRGALKDARLNMAQKRHRKHIDELIAAEKVVFNLNSAVGDE